MPVPVLARAPVPAMMPAAVRVVALEKVPVPVRVMPRLGSRVTVPVVARVALSTRRPAVGIAGAVPRAESAAIERVPALTVVMPA